MSRTIEVERIPTGKPNEFYVASVMHSKGQRRYFLSVIPMEFEQHDGYSVRKFGVFTGRNMTLEDGVKRYSAKRLQHWADNVKDQIAQIVEELRAVQEVEA